MSAGPVHIAADVARAIAAGKPVVALESSVFAQGLPRPANTEAAKRMTNAVSRAGAQTAITGVVRGVPTVGIGRRDLERFLKRDGIVKVSARDLAAATVQGLDGATTVAASLVLAHLAGIPVFATGGIGGVHHGEPLDESADLLELARTPMLVVCSGPKAILDLPATAERLETVGLTIVGYRTDSMPAFYAGATDFPVSVRLDSPAEIADLFRTHLRLARPGALVVMQPPPKSQALPSSAMENAVRKGLTAARRARVRGPAVTPFLLAAVERATGGRSLAANLALLEQNAALAAEIAVSLGSGRRKSR